MPDKDPSTYSIITYTWVIGLSLWGGVVNWLNKYRSGESRAINLAEFVGDLAISGFAGILTFYMSEAAQIDTLVTAALVGISGHMGSRALFLLERIITKRLEK